VLWVGKTWQDAFPPISRPWLLPWWFLKVHTGNLLAYPVGGPDFGSTATFLLVVAGCVALCVNGRGRLLLLLLGPLVLMFLAAAPRFYPYGTSARVALHMAPAFCLLAGLGLATALKLLVRRPHVPNAFRVAAGVLAVMAAVGIGLDVCRPYKDKADLLRRDALKSLGQTDRQGDQWVFFLAPRGTEAESRAPDLEKFGGSAAALRYYARRYLPRHRIHEAPDPQHISPGPHGRVVFVVYRDNKVRFSEDDEEKLRTYLAALTERFGRPIRQPPIGLSSPKDLRRGRNEHLELYRFNEAPPEGGPQPLPASSPSGTDAGDGAWPPLRAGI